MDKDIKEIYLLRKEGVAISIPITTILNKNNNNTKNNIKIKKIQYFPGTEELIFLDNFGTVNFIEINDNNNNNKQNNIYKQRKVKIRSKSQVFETQFKDIIVSEVTVFLIEELTNKVYTFGSNEWGQCGLGHKKNKVNRKEKTIYVEEVKCPKGSKFWSKVLTGYGHSYFLNDKKELYGCGNSTFGQLCSLYNEKEENVMVPTKIPDFNEERIDRIYSGYGYGIVKTESGKWFVFGYNDEQQLGYPSPTEILKPLPLPLKEGEIVKEVYAGQMVTILLLIDGTFKCFGGHGAFQIPTFNINNYNLVVNCYLYGNTFFLVERDCFYTMNGASCVKVKFCDILLDTEMLEDKLEIGNYKVETLFRTGYTDNTILILYEDYNVIEKHFIYLFDNELSDIDIL
ncbi:hypothetical protein ABK040_008744 [Willaertia magna]